MKGVLWVVEEFSVRGWEPTEGVNFTRQEGRDGLAEWRWRCPDGTFRLTRYLPAKTKETTC